MRCSKQANQVDNFVMQLGMVRSRRPIQHQRGPRGSQLQQQVKVRVAGPPEALHRRDNRSHQAGRSDWVQEEELGESDWSPSGRIHSAIHDGYAFSEAKSMQVETALTELKILRRIKLET